MVSRRGSISLGLGRRNTVSKPTEEAVDLYHVGLVNLGNSCFYNSILQCLSASRPLAEVIAHPPPTSPALLALSPTSPDQDFESPIPLPITQAFIELLAKLGTVPEPTGNRLKIFNPKASLRALSLKHEEYAEATQQDAHELLRHLLDDVLMEEFDLIKKLCPPPPPKKKGAGKGKHLRKQMRSMTIKSPSPSQGEEGGDRPKLLLSRPSEDAGDTAEPQEEDAVDDSSEDGSDEESSSSSSSSSSEDETENDADVEEAAAGTNGTPRKARYRPFIDDVFGGKLASVIVCETCKNVSLTKEDFLDISLPMKDDDGNKSRKRDRIKRTLQSGFFSSKKAAESSTSKPSPRPPGTPLVSLSETEASPSASEAETDTDAGSDTKRSPEMGASWRVGRRASLDPSALADRKSPGWPGGSNAKSRDASPLGRALSIVSRASNGKRESRWRKPKIPSPTPEQQAYISKVLAEIPGPGPTPLPPQLRFAQPGGGGGAAPSSDLASSASSVTSASSSLTAAESLHHVTSQASAHEQASTDLFAALRLFTAVEVLEGDNSFACRRCWKLLNPDLVKKRKEEKEQRKIQKRSSRHRSMTLSPASYASELPHSPAVQPIALGPPAGIALPPTPSPITTSSVSTPIKEEDEEEDITPGSSAVPTRVQSRDGSDDDGPRMPNLKGQLSRQELDSALADVEDLGEQTDTSLESSAEASSGPAGAKGDTTTAKVAPLTAENVGVIPDATKSSNGALMPGNFLRKGKSEDALSQASSASIAAPSSAVTSASSKALGKQPEPPRVRPPKIQRQIMRKAQKRYLLSPNLPPILALHLKRFQQTSKSSLFGDAFVNLKKRDDFVSFPLEMDLSPFVAPVGKPPKPGQPSKGPTPAVKDPAFAAPSARYRLYGVVVHAGNLALGHYVSYVLSDRYFKLNNNNNKGRRPSKSGSESSLPATPEMPSSASAAATAGPGSPKVSPPSGSDEVDMRKWVYSSDDLVRTCSVDEVLKCKAYVLFYERVPGPAAGVAKSRI